MNYYRQILSYIGVRLPQAIFVVWAAFTVSFLILYFLPGDAISIKLGIDNDISQADIEKLQSQYGIDKPIYVQYFVQLGNALRGDLGYSIQTGQRVSDALTEAFPHTLALTLSALLVALVIALVLATLAVYTRLPWLRRFVLSLPPLGVSVPTFWIGLTLLQFFSFRLRVFPATGNDSPWQLVLPAITLAIPTSASLTKVFTQGLESELAKAYVSSARGRGRSRRSVFFRHVAKNALLPSITLLALTLGELLAGSVVTETVFSRAGIGRIAYNAVSGQDLPVVQGVVLISALLFVLSSLVSDIVYPLIDPRVALKKTTREKTTREKTQEKETAR